MTFQELQFLYNESKKYNSILEVYPENGRGTHALITGCNGIVTILTKTNDNTQLLESIEYPGNLRVVTSDNVNKIKDEKFDLIIINLENGISETDTKNRILEWEFNAKRILCGHNYNNNKKNIDSVVEISDKVDNIWYKNISQFEKTITYRRKN